MFILKRGKDGGQPWVITLHQFISAGCSWEATRRTRLSPAASCKQGSCSQVVLLAAHMLSPSPLISSRTWAWVQGSACARSKPGTVELPRVMRAQPVPVGQPCADSVPFSRETEGKAEQSTEKSPFVYWRKGLNTPAVSKAPFRIHLTSLPVAFPSIHIALLRAPPSYP